MPPTPPSPCELRWGESHRRGLPRARDLGTGEVGGLAQLPLLCPASLTGQLGPKSRRQTGGLSPQSEGCRPPSLRLHPACTGGWRLLLQGLRAPGVVPRRRFLTPAGSQARTEEDHRRELRRIRAPNHPSSEPAFWALGSPSTRAGHALQKGDGHVRSLGCRSPFWAASGRHRGLVLGLSKPGRAERFWGERPLEVAAGLRTPSFAPRLRKGAECCLQPLKCWPGASCRHTSCRCCSVSTAAFGPLGPHVVNEGEPTPLVLP